jgi:hypothetical protein
LSRAAAPDDHYPFSAWEMWRITQAGMKTGGIVRSANAVLSASLAAPRYEMCGALSMI